MGLFSNASPFDADVEKATNENNTSEAWGEIMDICDKVGNSSVNAKDCLRSISRRLQNQDPHIVLQAITLLDACVSNCGKVFQLEVASRDFEGELRKLIQRPNQPKLTDKAKSVIKKWAEGDFKGDPQLGLIPSLYHKLRQEGVDFTPTHQPTKQTWKASTDPDSVSSQQEVDDIAKAIELSLKESGSPSATKKQQESTSLYPSVASMTLSSSSGNAGSTSTRKVRALYDFEAAEDNELTFSAGEIIDVIDDSDANWWKGSSHRGEGLFPSNFVTSQLSSPPSTSKSEKKSIQFNEVVEVKKIKIPEQIEIDETKIDRLLTMFNEADPNDGQDDSEEMLALEDEVYKMGPLIDAELEKLDKKSAELTIVGSSLVDAMNMYHSLMHEPAHHQHHMGPSGVYKMPPPPQAMFNPPPSHQPVFNGGFYPPVGPPPGSFMVPPPSQEQLAQPAGPASLGPPPPGVHNGTGMYHHPPPPPTHFLPEQPPP